MKQRILFGRLILAPALVLMVLAIVAGGQIIGSRDLLNDVRVIDETLVALHTNGEALERLHAAEVALKLYQNGPGPQIESLRLQLLHEASRLKSLAPDLAALPQAGLEEMKPDSSKQDADLLLKFARLLEQIGTDAGPGGLRAESQHLQTLLNDRLKSRDQAFHQILAEIGRA
ncbi:MAG: hypothetical protein EPN26_06070, partial [Rhodospirillales bacterium]